MNIIISLHREWTEKITENIKPFEFRTKLPKNLKIGDTLFLYETSKHGGQKKIIGECKVKSILPLTNEKGEYPMYGAYNLIDYYYNKIKHLPEIGEKFRKVKEEFGNKLENYRYGSEISYAFSEKELESLRKTGNLLNLWDTTKNSFDDEELKEILDDNEKAYKYIEECDDWLRSIGFYNDGEESFWTYAIEIYDVKKYDVPKSLNEFNNQNGNPIAVAPQSWCYTTTEGKK